MRYGSIVFATFLAGVRHQPEPLRTTCWRPRSAHRRADRLHLARTASGATLKKLESFETRNSLSSTDSPTRGIGAARQWILDEMKSYSPKLQVELRHVSGAEAGPHHARRRTAQRDGDSAGQKSAAHLRQRPLRHGRARPGGQSASNRPMDRAIRTRRRRRPPIRRRRSTTWRPASTTTAAARR